MPELLFPERDELDYLEKILTDERTMAFRGGTVAFPEEKRDGFLSEWQDDPQSGKYFRLIFCEGCGYFVGACAYRKTAEDIAELYLLIEKDLREEGYGSWALKEIGRIAEEEGIRQFTVSVLEDTPYLKYLKKRGFTLKEKDGGQLILQAKTSDLARGKTFGKGLRCCCRKNRREKDA